MTTTAKPMTESQFNYAVGLACQIYADPGVRAQELLKIAGLDFHSISVRIDELKALKFGVTHAPAAAAMPAYVPPLGHYLVNGKHLHLKKAKYTDAVYVYLDGKGYVGTVGKSAAANDLIAPLNTPQAAYAAVVEFAKATGKCGVCHTKLTDPKSIAAGIGPVCAKKYGK